jgi:hypothetical protein
VVVAVEAEVHLVVREREVELVLPLREGVSVGRRLPPTDLLGDAQRARHRVHLALVEMGDRLEVRRAVPPLHEEPLVVLQPVRSARHGVVEPFSPEILGELPGALLHVGRRDDREIRRQREARAALGAVGCGDDEAEDVEAGVVFDLGENDLRAPTRAVLREHRADGRVALPVTPHRGQRGTDRNQLGRGRRSVAAELSELQAQVVGIVSGMKGPKTRSGPSAGGERGHQRAVDAAGDADDDALAPQLEPYDLADAGSMRAASTFQSISRRFSRTRRLPTCEREF